jgi:cell wall-associated NlpC family hydrolase
MPKNKKNIKFLKAVFLSCLLVFSFSIVSSAFAQALVPCGLDGKADCTLCHLVLGFKNIYDYLLYVVLLPAAILVIIIAGVMYIVSSGSKGLIEKAKSAFVYALTALVLALLAWLLINATLHALGYTNAGNWYTFTCDTTQSTGSGTTGAGGATLPPSGGGTGAGTGKGGGISGKGSDINVPQDGSKLAQILEKEKGAIYVWGKDAINADGTLITDCSGWTKDVWKETYGVDIPRYSGDQGNQAFNYSQLTNGTILESPGHVGIYYNGSVYHNSGSGRDVRVVNLDNYLSQHNVTEMRLPPS